MELAQKAFGVGAALGAVLDGEPDKHGDDDAEGKAEEEGTVLAGGAEDFDGANGSPENGGCEEGVWAGAEEAHGWVFCAYTGDVDLRTVSKNDVYVIRMRRAEAYLEIHHASADEG